MAVIKNKKTNTYEVRTYYKDWTGVRKQKTKRGFKRKCDAQDWERAFKLKENRSLDMTFGDFVDIYLNDIKPRIKYNTWLTKKHIVDKKILPYFADRKLQEIKTADIRQWQNMIMNHRDANGKREKGELLKRTISFMTGKGSVNHNSRKFHAKNTDPKRSHWNVEYCNQDIREVYHELFDEALDRYNSKQTRKDRKIEDYYEKIRSGKQEKPFHEIILQIGDKNNMGATTKEGQMAARILDEYMKDFQRRNPTLRVFSAHLHMDEATPHLHIDFVPYTTGSKRGLDTRVSLKQALSALGFKGGTRMETELNQWVAAEKQKLASIMLDHGIEWEQKGTHEKHLSLLDFEKQERAKEVAALEEQKADLEEHNATMQEVNEKWLDHLKNIEQDISSARESWKEADKKAEQAKKNVAQYEKKLTEIAPMVKEMERFAEKYSADPEEVLPEAGTLETGKSYREKKAKPLIKKIVTVLRSVYRAYFDLSRRFNDIQRSYERAGNKVNSLTTRVEELWNENRMLRENLEDFERVKEALGHDTVKTIVQAERQREQALKEQKRAQRRKMDRGAK